jgi:arabinofuranan 3-O-arabinosyltransferase
MDFARQRLLQGVVPVVTFVVTVPLAAAGVGVWSLVIGPAAVQLGGRRLPLGGRVARDGLDGSRPLRLHGCAAIDLPARAATLAGAVGTLRADGLRLRSAAPVPVAVPPFTGAVLYAGIQRDAARDGVRLHTTAPSWLVLGQSYDRGWRASCDGRDLGAPRPMQGYANGWPVGRGCTDVRFSYRPQRLATAGYAVSGLGCVLLLLLLVARRPRAAEAAPAAAPEPLPAPAVAPRRLPPRSALAIGAAAALVLGFCFGLRAGAVLGPLLALALWRGVGDRVLTAAATAVLAAGVPAAYLIAGALSDRGNPGGYDSGYATDRIAGHWLALGALTRSGSSSGARSPPPAGRDRIRRRRTARPCPASG